MICLFLQHLYLPSFKRQFFTENLFHMVGQGLARTPICQASVKVLKWADDFSHAQESTSWGSAAGALRKDGLFLLDS